MDKIISKNKIKTPADVNYKEIEEDKTLSKEELIFTSTSGNKTHNIVWKKRNAQNEIYYLFEYVEGKPLQAWSKGDYEIAEKQINIDNISIVLYLPNDKTQKYLQIETNWRY